MAVTLGESSSQPQISTFLWTKVKDRFSLMITWTVQTRSTSMWMTSTPLMKQIPLSTLAMVSCWDNEANVMQINDRIWNITNKSLIFVQVASFCDSQASFQSCSGVSRLGSLEYDGVGSVPRGHSWATLTCLWNPYTMPCTGLGKLKLCGQRKRLGIGNTKFKEKESVTYSFIYTLAV